MTKPEQKKKKLLGAPGTRLAGSMRKLEHALAHDPGELGARIRDFTQRFHNYSARNRMLILAQRPDATYLKGRKQWEALGRTVKPRARGVRILAPVGKPGQPKVPGLFTEVKIYDVADTLGPPFDVPTTTDVKADDALVDDLLGQLERWARGSGLQLLYKSYPSVNRVVDGATNGVRIWVRPDLPPSARLAVLAHEIAHVKMHFPKKQRGTGLVLDGPKDVPNLQERELQAELVAYFMLELSGIDSAKGAAAYLTCWKVSARMLRKHAGRCLGVASSVLREAAEGTYRSLVGDGAKAGARGAATCAVGPTPRAARARREPAGHTASTRRPPSSMPKTEARASAGRGLTG